MDGPAELNLGVIGITEGNGHPYSFSSIVNGYSNAGFERSEWQVIHEYLREKDESEFGFPGVSVSHAWTQDPKETDILCEAAKIPNAVSRRSEMKGAVDGVLLLRDDYDRHLEMALPFLEAGVPVFIDKPLTLTPAALDEFAPYIRNGLLMSCSGMRYASGLDAPRSSDEAFGRLRLIRGTIIKDWERYGIHLLDAIYNAFDLNPVAVTHSGTDRNAMEIIHEDGPRVQIDTLGDAAFVFEITAYGTEQAVEYNLTDNFTSFRRTLWHFIEAIRSGNPAIPPQETLTVLRTLIAGVRARDEGTVEIESL
jgi:hypothetical protein